MSASPGRRVGRFPRLGVVRLLLIRHGQTPANVRGELDTRAPGPGLTGLGQQQAEALPAQLAGRAVDAIFVSSLVRTHLTAAPLAAARGLQPVELADLREIEAGELEGRRDDAAVRQYHELLASWIRGETSAVLPGAYDGATFFERYDGAVREVASTTTGVAVVVSHGAAIRTWAGSRATNVDAEFVTAELLDNTGVVELEGGPDAGWTCLAWAGEPLGGEHLADRSAPDPTGARL